MFAIVNNDILDTNNKQKEETGQNYKGARDITCRHLKYI